MQDLHRNAVGGNPIIPPAGDMPGWVQEQHAVRERITTAEIVEQPTVGQPAFDDSYFYWINGSGLYRWPRQ